MSTFRQRVPSAFTKQAIADRAKMPKEPIYPRMPIEPVAPPKMLKKNRQILEIDIGGVDTITSTTSVTIPLDELLKVRAKINVPDENVSLVVTSSNCGYDDGAEIESAYFEWYDSFEDPKYEQKFEKYQIELQKYNEKKAAYEANLEQYQKDMRAHKKAMKTYRLELMKEQKAKLEAQIAKAETQNK